MSGCCCCDVSDVSDAEAYLRHRDAASPTAEAAQTSVGLDDFEMLAVLGRGSYGRVLQVRKRGSRQLYAMKVMRKADVVMRNQVRHTLTEHNLLRSMRHHPFIVPLHYAFQTADNLYLVLALQSGGELFFHLRREGAFAEPRVRLYAAEILLALEALHAAGYVYRDLKPENVLLDGDGHVRLSDFGLAKGAMSALDSGASTFCGTPSYMAPEVLLGTGHGVAVDWWSLGTLVYEMLAGAPPFYSRNVHAMYRSILTAELRVGPHVSRAARALLEGLLKRDPLRRLGAKGSAQVRKAAFFRPLSFAKVASRAYPPAFRPTLVGASPSLQALDVSNFDEAFTAEDPHTEPAPAAPPATATTKTTTGEGGPVHTTTRTGTGSDEGGDMQTTASPPSVVGCTDEQQDAFASWGYVAPHAD